jgi:hypothetical protein
LHANRGARRCIQFFAVCACGLASRACAASTISRCHRLAAAELALKPPSRVALVVSAACRKGPEVCRGRGARRGDQVQQRRGEERRNWGRFHRHHRGGVGWGGVGWGGVQERRCRPPGIRQTAAWQNECQPARPHPPPACRSRPRCMTPCCGRHLRWSCSRSCHPSASPAWRWEAGPGLLGRGAMRRARLFPRGRREGAPTCGPTERVARVAGAGPSRGRWGAGGREAALGVLRVASLATLSSLGAPLYIRVHGWVTFN